MSNRAKNPRNALAYYNMLWEGKHSPGKRETHKAKHTENQHQIDRTELCDAKLAHTCMRHTLHCAAASCMCITGKKSISTHFLKQFHSLLVISQCIKTNEIEIKIESKSSACIEFKPDLYSEIVCSVRPTDL